MSHCIHSPGGGSLSLHTYLWRWTGCTCAGCPHPCVLSQCLLPLPATAEPTPTLTFCLAGETGANHPVIRERPLLRWVGTGWQPKVSIRGLATGGDMLSGIGKRVWGRASWVVAVAPRRDKVPHRLGLTVAASRLQAARGQSSSGRAVRALPVFLFSAAPSPCCALSWGFDCPVCSFVEPVSGSPGWPHAISKGDDHGSSSLELSHGLPCCGIFRCLFEDQAEHRCHWSPRPLFRPPAISQKPSSASYPSRKPLKEVGSSLTSCSTPPPPPPPPPPALLGKGLVPQAPPALS